MRCGLLMFPFLLTACASAQEYPVPGRMVDIGGRSLHIDCRGEGNGPVVVIDSGAVASSVHYREAQAAISPTARVCTYDRAGAGWSDPAAAGRTLEDRASDLAALLAASAEKPPYVLVGHSMGGFIIRLFAREHRRDVAGIVLMESSEEELTLGPASQDRLGQTKRQLETAANAAAIGLLPAISAATGLLKPPPGAPVDWGITLRPNNLRAGADDINALMLVPEGMRRSGGLGTLGALPLVVVTRGRPSDPGDTSYDEFVRARHERLAALSTNSRLLIAEKSGHNVNYDQPEMFREAVEVLKQLMLAPSPALGTTVE